MANISRLKDAEISNGNVINADDLDAEFNQLVSSFNTNDTLLTSIDTGSYTFAGVKTFTSNPKTNGIDERTAGSGVTLDGLVLAKDGFIRIPAGASYNPTVASEIGYDSTTGLFKAYDGAVKPIDLAGGVNAQTGTTYTVLTGDRNKLVTLSNASAIAVTLPQAGSAGFLANYKTRISNIGVGTATITPTTSTIDGAASLTLATNQSVGIYSDGANYFTDRGRSAAQGLVRITGATVSAAASASVTTASAFDGTYDTLIWNIWDIQAATDAVQGYFRISLDGSTFRSTANDYEWQVMSSVGGTSLPSGTASDTEIQLTGSDANNTFSNVAGEIGFISITTHLPTSTTLAKHFVWSVSLQNAATPNPVAMNGSGYFNGTTGALLGFQFLTSSGNVSCKHALYGLRAS